MSDVQENGSPTMLEHTAVYASRLLQAGEVKGTQNRSLLALLREPSTGAIGVRFHDARPPTPSIVPGRRITSVLRHVPEQQVPASAESVRGIPHKDQTTVHLTRNVVEPHIAGVPGQRWVAICIPPTSRITWRACSSHQGAVLTHRFGTLFE